MSRMISTAHRLETGVRSALSGLARRRGPAVLPYAGYGGAGRVRLLCRVLLAPPGTDPSARRSVPGWQRFLTLELPDTEVEVGEPGMHRTVRSGRGGFVDETLPLGHAPGVGSVAAHRLARSIRRRGVLHRRHRHDHRPRPPAACRLPDVRSDERWGPSHCAT